MLRTQRAPILALALVLAASLATPALVSAAARMPAATRPATASAVIQPGSVNRSSFALRVTYDVNVTLHYGDRLLVVDSVMTITNTSGGPIDRLELNTIAARLGGLRVVAASVESRAVTVGISDQTLIVPLGGILPAGDTVQARLIYSAHLRADLAGSDWMFTRANGVIDAYRWLPWASLRIPFTRPNHGDPFITPVSPSVTVRITTDRPLVFATTGDRVGGSGLSQTFAAQDVRDFT
ncbi:MAG: hypothetical protein M3067_01445, partial [Chloroflexota bacterium]|nr:hypothetical protein [Chloroflexota bacterium]